jgi:hypothetical protein
LHYGDEISVIFVIDMFAVAFFVPLLLICVPFWLNYFFCQGYFGKPNILIKSGFTSTNWNPIVKKIFYSHRSKLIFFK